MNTTTDLSLLMSAGISKTTFKTLPVKETNNVGISIGQGACKAVIIKLNFFMRNAEDSAEQIIEQIYIGDTNAQEFELLTGTNSPVIFCENLEEIFVRNPYPSIAYVQVLIYN